VGQCAEVGLSEYQIWILNETEKKMIAMRPSENIDD
jgi:hypothetical protein